MLIAPVSVVIPVFNRFDLLEKTLSSILNQTVSPLEIILVDDGSQDGTRERILKLTGPTIRVVLNAENLGAGSSRNRGIDAAKGEFLCLTDQDDIWHPEKLQKQLDRVANPDKPVLVGTSAETFTEIDGNILRGRQFSHYADDESLREYFFYSSPFVSSSVMVRSSAIEKHQLRFRTDMGKSSCEDYDLWWKLSLVGPIANVPEVLLKYREHPTQQSRLREDEMIKYSEVVRDQILLERGVTLTPKQRLTLSKEGRYIPANPQELGDIRSLLRTFLEQRAPIVSRNALRVHGEMAFQTVCRSDMSVAVKTKSILGNWDLRLGTAGYILNQLNRLKHQAV